MGEKKLNKINGLEIANNSKILLVVKVGVRIFSKINENLTYLFGDIVGFF